MIFSRYETQIMIAVPALLFLATISCSIPIHNLMTTMNVGATTCNTMQGVLFPPTTSKFNILLLSFLFAIAYLFLRRLLAPSNINSASAFRQKCKRILAKAHNPLREILSRGILHPKIYNAAFIF